MPGPADPPPAPGASGAGQQGGFLLSQVHQVSGRVFERLLREAGLGELTAARGRIVFALMRKDGIPQNELAAMVRLDKSGLALTLAELESGGLVERRRSQRDRRQSLVYRSGRFDELIQRFTEVSRQMTEIYYRGLEDAAIAAFERTLAHILANLDNMEQSGIPLYTDGNKTHEGPAGAAAPGE